MNNLMYRSAMLQSLENSTWWVGNEILTADMDRLDNPDYFHR